MKILLDTNIILDIALMRQPFYEQADRIFSLIEKKQIEGYVSGSAISDIYYILKKQNGKEWSLEFLKQLIYLCQISPITDQIIKQSIDRHYKDLEDDIQYYSAIFQELDGIVTRNIKDYPQVSLKILTPMQLLSIFE